MIHLGLLQVGGFLSRTVTFLCSVSSTKFLGARPFDDCCCRVLLLSFLLRTVTFLRSASNTNYVGPRALGDFCGVTLSTGKEIEAGGVVWGLPCCWAQCTSTATCRIAGKGKLVATRTGHDGEGRWWGGDSYPTMSSSAWAAMTPCLIGNGESCLRPLLATGGVGRQWQLNGGEMTGVSGSICCGDGVLLSSDWHGSTSSSSSMWRIEFCSSYSVWLLTLHESNNGTGITRPGGGRSHRNALCMLLKYGLRMLPLWWFRHTISARCDSNHDTLVPLIFLKWSRKRELDNINWTVI